MRLLWHFGAVLCACASAAAQPVSSAFTYQGELRSSGLAVAGPVDLRFALYTAATGGSQIGGVVDASGVQLTQGRFSLPLDFGAGAFGGATRYLEIQVRNPAGVGAYTVLSPRQTVVAAPVSQFALQGNLALPFAGSGASGANATVDVTSTTGGAIIGIAANVNGNPAGLSGLSPAPAGIGVFGRATSATGANFGGWFQTLSPTGDGVRGDAIPATGVSNGVHGQNASASGRGVFGQATATTGFNFGVFGQAVSSNGVGVKGLSALNHGVVGEASGSGADGVFGHSTNTNAGFGVFGQSDSPSGHGVFGTVQATSGVNFGVRGEAFSTSAYGVYGVCTNYGVYASGNLGSNGTKSFRIDHPSDPEHRYLLHYCAESPEVINFYSGKTVLNAAGEAIVELPSYFALVNKDPRYMLTAVGGPMPLLHIATEISDEALAAGEGAEPGDAPPRCWFRIAGGMPGGKVSWEVKAVRNDRWVRVHGAPVEHDKQGSELGVCERPELYPKLHE